MHDKRMQKIHLKQPKEQAKWDKKVQLCRPGHGMLSIHLWSTEELEDFSTCSKQH